MRKVEENLKNKIDLLSMRRSSSEQNECIYDDECILQMSSCRTIHPSTPQKSVTSFLYILANKLHGIFRFRSIGEKPRTDVTNFCELMAEA